jgi:NADPH-dependent 2,4-dienoyl-CoA reductase/sulfur reductase-like enzyme/rhodanese-related sulfurtransferase
MSERKSDFVVIGGVAAGSKTAATLRRRLPDATITLYQKEQLLSYASCGMPYFASGDIESFQKLMMTPYDVVRDKSFFDASKGFEAVVGAEVTRVDSEKKIVTVKVLETGETYEHEYGKLVLATGAVPVRPKFPVAESPKIRHFTRPDDAIAFRKAAQQGEIGKAVIVGAGYIGCEVTESAAGLWGTETVLIEKEDQILPKVLDPEMAAIAHREIEKQGVTLMTGAGVEGVGLDDDGNPVVRIKGQESIAADYVMLCLGVQPNAALAEDCGLRIGKTGGVLVDSHMRSSDPDIYAGGDCVELYHQITGAYVYAPLGALANRHGRGIAENLAGNETEFRGVVGSFFVKIFDVNVGSVGLSEREADAVDFRAEAVWGSFADKPDFYPESKLFTAKMVFAADDGRLLGLQAVGSGNVCSHIDVFSSFLQRRATLPDLLDFEHGYAPPYSEPIDPLHHLASMAVAQARGVQFVAPGIAFPDGALVLDLREEHEVTSKPWPTDDGLQLIQIPSGELAQRIDELDRSKAVYIVCGRGSRSYQAALKLGHEGFENVFIVGGGVAASLK